MQIVKYLQAQGVGTKKDCQNLVKYGAIRINGELIDNLKAKVDLKTIASVHIDDEPLPWVPLPYFYILMHKPADFETSHKPTNYPSIFGLFPDNMRLMDLQAIGRLDADTTGLLLITNDGGYNHRVTSPKHKVPKLYQVTLKHAADDDYCAKLMKGVILNDADEFVQAHHAELKDEHTLLMTITEGRYHQVKRMIAAAGNRVEGLHRLSFGEFELGDTPVSSWHFVTPTVLASQD